MSKLRLAVFMGHAYRAAGSGKRLYAFGRSTTCQEVRFASRNGRKAENVLPIVDATWEWVCVEGDAGRWNLGTGPFAPEGGIGCQRS